MEKDMRLFKKPKKPIDEVFIEHIDLTCFPDDGTSCKFEGRGIKCSVSDCPISRIEKRCGYTGGMSADTVIKDYDIDTSDAIMCKAIAIFNNNQILKRKLAAWKKI